MRQPLWFTEHVTSSKSSQFTSNLSRSFLSLSKALKAPVIAAWKASHRYANANHIIIHPIRAFSQKHWTCSPRLKTMGLSFHWIWRGGCTNYHSNISHIWQPDINYIIPLSHNTICIWTGNTFLATLMIARKLPAHNILTWIAIKMFCSISKRCHVW